MGFLFLRSSAAAVANTTYGGLTPTRYVAPFASVSGASSDMDAQNATAYTNATSEGSPCTLACAMANATAGHIVGVLNGVYTGVSTDSPTDPIFNPANSGTAGNPITFITKYRAALNRGSTNLYSEIRSDSVIYTPPAASTACPAIGATSADYIVFDGWFLDYTEHYPGATGGMITFRAADNCVARWNLITATGASATDGFNANHIYSEDSVGLLIENNIFVDNASTHHNDACIETYSARDTTIQYNFFDCTSGYAVFHKGAVGGVHHDNNVVRYNLCSNAALTVLDTLAADIYQNLVTGNVPLAGFVFEGGTWDDLRVYNNTFSVTGANVLGARLESTTSTDGGNRFYNNIVVVPNQAVSEIVNAGDASANNAQYFDLLDYNVYYASGGTTRWSIAGASQTTIANWRTALASNSAPVGARDTNSQVSDPTFVGGGDYHLQGGSAALTAGNTGGPCGCYITGSETIGNQS